MIRYLKLCFAKNTVHSGATGAARSLHCFATVFHCNLVSVLYFSLVFALYAISFHTVQIQNRRYKATGRAVLVPVTDLLLSKYPIIVIKSLELESITTRIQEKHRGLFSGFTFEPCVGLYDESYSGIFQTFG